MNDILNDLKNAIDDYEANAKDKPISIHMHVDTFDVLYEQVHESEAIQQELLEALQNILGHINTPISRRKLGIKEPWPEWLTQAVEVLKKAETKD